MPDSQNVPLLDPCGGVNKTKIHAFHVSMYTHPATRHPRSRLPIPPYMLARTKKKTTRTQAHPTRIPSMPPTDDSTRRNRHRPPHSHSHVLISKARSCTVASRRSCGRLPEVAPFARTSSHHIVRAGTRPHPLQRWAAGEISSARSLGRSGTQPIARQMPLPRVSSVYMPMET